MKHVLILGGGFASISVARQLSKWAKKSKHMEVSLVCEHNYFTFQPMLPQVAAGSIEPSHVINPIRQLCPNVTVHRATVDHIDILNKRVKIVGSDFTRQKYIHYDHLVVGLGQRTDLSRVPGLSEHSIPIKTLGDAFFLRNEIINKLEEAAIETDRETKRALLTFVVVGGGFSGVETVGEVGDMLKTAVKRYKNISPEDLRIVLVHSKKEILNELSPKLGAFAQKKLMARGIECQLNCRISEVSPNEIRLSNGHVIHTKTVVSAIGNAPHPVLLELPFINANGRLDSNEYCQVVDYNEGGDLIDNVWTVGDCANIPDLYKQKKTKTPSFCPPTAQYATRQGLTCAKNIFNSIHEKKMRPFKFKQLGQLAVIGHLCGVAEVFGVRFSGFIAYILWRAIYWGKLPGIHAKMRVAFDWCISALFPADITQLDVFRTEKVNRSHYPKNSYIFKEGDIADHFYIIEKGTVEVIKTGVDGRAHLLATLSEGDSFGEMGLMQKAPRSASILCKTPVGVITVDRNDFLALSGSYSKLKTELNQKISDIEHLNQEYAEVLEAPADATPSDTESKLLEKAKKDAEAQAAKKVAEAESAASPEPEAVAVVEPDTVETVQEISEPAAELKPVDVKEVEELPAEASTASDAVPAEAEVHDLSPAQENTAPEEVVSTQSADEDKPMFNPIPIIDDSFEEEHLEHLERRHQPAQAVEAPVVEETAEIEIESSTIEVSKLRAPADEKVEVTKIQKATPAEEELSAEPAELPSPQATVAVTEAAAPAPEKVDPVATPAPAVVAETPAPAPVQDEPPVQAVPIQETLKKVRAEKKEQSLMNEVRQGDDAMRNMDFASATMHYRKAAKIDPNITTLIRYSQSLIKQHKELEAIQVLKQAMQQDGNNPDVIDRLANAYFHIHQYSSAQKLLEYGIKKHPSHVNMHYQLCQILFKDNRVPRAKGLLTHLLSLQPDHVSARHLLGKCYYKNTEYKKAFQQFEIASGGAASPQLATQIRSDMNKVRQRVQNVTDLI